MIEKDNFAVKLCGLLQHQTSQYVSAQEWRLVGQENGGTQIFTWQTVSTTKKNVTNIGIYTHKTDSLRILHVFDEPLNIIQASVNSSHTLIVYVLKNVTRNAFSGTGEAVIFGYKPFILLLDSCSSPKEIEIERSKQIMVQFLHQKYSYTPKTLKDSFLLMVHLECIKKYSVNLFHENDETVLEPQWQMENTNSPPDIIVKSFSWAQWDPVNQALYYIHYRTQNQSFSTGEDAKASVKEISPTLSALQFHTELPHETVLNIPLNLPQLPTTSEAPSCGQYEDDPVPLRIHDCSLDLLIISDPSGIVCICHHYLYQPLDDSTQGSLNDIGAANVNVHFAYSVTLLHHGSVIHCVIPDVPWSLAKSLRPSFCLYGDHHLLVNVPMICTHLLDIGLTHEVNCHIVLPARESSNGHYLASLINCGSNAMVDLVTLDIVTISITDSQITDTFKSDTAIENKLSILHYLIQHQGNCDLVDQLVSWMFTAPTDKCGLLERVLKEYLISWSYITTKRCLPTSALPLTFLLPYTTNNKFVDVKMGGTCISVRQEHLWSPAVVLLSPRQRVAPFCSDLWTRLWDGLTPAALASSDPNARTRFRPKQVRDKLRVSLDCYQPEALSRCTTPMSPTTVTLPHTAMRRSSLTSHSSDMLPFYEFDSCTASKQEHIISVNLREMSMHLMQSCTGGSGVRGGSGGTAQAHAHAVATRWAGAQLEASRALALVACRAASTYPQHDRQRGFTFIDEMSDDHRYILFKTLEIYYLATDSIAFPVPQGFASFFTYLGYKVLSFDKFVLYVHRNVFELQIDVLKAIVAEEGNTTAGVERKLRLIQLVGRGRARRALTSWAGQSSGAGQAALILRARDHTNTILAGHAPPPMPRHNPPHTSHFRRGSRTAEVVPHLAKQEWLSPLNTFLDMLTAKANLNELDFNLVIEATFAMMPQNT